MIDIFTRQDAYQDAYNQYVHDCEVAGKAPISFEEYAANGYRSFALVTPTEENDCF